MIEVDLVAEMGVFNPFDFFLEPYAEQCPFTYDPALARELRPYLETEPAGPQDFPQHSWLESAAREKREQIDTFWSASIKA